MQAKSNEREGNGIMRQKAIGKLVFFGLAGHCIELAPYMEGTLNYGQGSLSGYDNPERFEKELASGHYADYELEGALVIDKRAVLEENPGLSWKSPMCSVSIVDDLEIKRCPEVDPIMASAMRGNQFGTLIAMQAIGYGKEKPTDPGLLDDISPRAYCRWWHKYGARLGQIRNNSIVWDIEV
jgi:hypothetical protein